MNRPVGIETEYGINYEGFAGPVDFAYEASAIVRSAPLDGALRSWDYRREDPRLDLRGMRVAQLAHDPHDLHSTTERSQRLSRDELLANTVLTNGARFYNDHNHPEYCTDACATLADLVAQDRAGERVLYLAERARNEVLSRERGGGARVRLVKNNTDYHGRSFGTHENYLVARAWPFTALARVMVPFLVTRQVYAGAGKVGLEGRYGQTTNGNAAMPAAGFQLSQRADFFEQVVGINTTAQRPILNTRDEPHADRKKYRRLHVIIGDANRCEYATALKVGATALALDLGELGWVPSVELAEPVMALQAISHDLTLSAPLSTRAGPPTTAVAVQREFHEAARREFAGRDPETDWVLREWATVLDLLVSTPQQLRDRLDWVAKWVLFEGIRQAQGQDWSSPALRRLDLAYHLVNPESSLFATLSKRGALRRYVDEPAIARAHTEPPAGTRAAIRALCLRKFGGQIRQLEWDSVTFGINGREVVLHLDEVWGSKTTRIEELTRRAASLDALIATLKSGGTQ